MEKDDPSELATPPSVKAIISRIETAQLMRAQEDIASQLSGILGNVNCAINRFQEELGYDLKEKADSRQSDQKSKERFTLLEKIASFSNGVKAKEQHLCEIRRWLADWGESLTYEIRSRESEEEEEVVDEWIEVMEKVLPLSLIATKGGIESLISLCSTLIEEQRKKTQISRHTFWRGWWDISSPKSTAHRQPLSPEQMLQDRHTTCTRVSEVTSMLQELLDSAMFSRGEVKAIRYMLATVENLSKALMLQHKENRSLESKCQCLQAEMTRELSRQRLHFQRATEALESKQDALLKQVKVLQERHRDLLLTKHALAFQLENLQAARGQAGDLPQVLAESPGPLEKESSPKDRRLMEETHHEAQKREQVSSPAFSSPVTLAWDGGAMPPAHQPLSTMTMHSRVADAYNSKDTEGLEPPLISLDHKLPEKRESLGLGAGDRKDHFEEKGGLHVKPRSGKSSGKAPPENQGGCLEEELSREKQRPPEEEGEEETGLPLQEWPSREQLRPWEMEWTARGQPQRSQKQPESPRRELGQPREDVGRTVCTTTCQRRNRKAEPLPAPPPSRAQSACQGRRPHLPRSPSIRQPRTMSAVEFTQKPWACRVPTKPKKSASFPVTGTPVRRVAQPSRQRSPSALRETTYHLDTEAQRKNLQLLREASELGLPHHLHSKASELIAATLELGVLRLQCLCHKYILYRRFQGLRLEVMSRLRVSRESGAASEAQNLRGLLERMGRWQSLQLQAWADRQKGLEEKRQGCLSSMVTIFPKLQLEWNIHLSIPGVTSRKPRKCKSLSAVPWRRLCSASPTSPTGKQPSQCRRRECVSPRMIRQAANQMEAVWKTDVASSSHPIEKKTPMSFPWGPQGCFPDIPRLLAVQVHPPDHRGLAVLQARCVNAFSASAARKKRCQEPTDEAAEPVGEKPSKPLPGTAKSPKDRGGPNFREEPEEIAQPFVSDPEVDVPHGSRLWPCGCRRRRGEIVGAGGLGMVAPRKSAHASVGPGRNLAGGVTHAQSPSL
ncbi:protein FAM186B [Lepus europaeus]|uniref:protein FAM186B n=1 Tax=Lepus europaeus TaxID=9983 RepID=UPI002B49AAC1|nr:protein FAM186B [Lepus europaeus]